MKTRKKRTKKADGRSDQGRGGEKEREERKERRSSMGLYVQGEKMSQGEGGDERKQRWSELSNLEWV